MDQKNCSALKKIKPKKHQKNYTPWELEHILGLKASKYDIFVSYCHFDNGTGYIDKFLKHLKRTYHTCTGESASIFIDRHELMTADAWKNKISKALNQSRLMLAMISPSYIKSLSCQQEWFGAENKEHRIHLVHNHPIHTIFPIQIHSLERALLSVEEKMFIKKARERQWADFAKIKTNSVLFQKKMEKLIEDIIDQGQLLKSILFCEQNKQENIIFDQQTKLMWAKKIPPVQMKFEEALEYVGLV